MAKSGPSPRYSSRPVWRHPLFVISIVAAICALIGLVVSAFNPSSVATTILSNIATFIASALVSYLYTYNQERQQFAADRAKLSDFASRRVDILSANLNSLTSEIEPIETVEETKRIVQYTLRNLAKDAELSVRDIEDMGRVDEQEEIRIDESPTALEADLPRPMQPELLPDNLQPAVDEAVTYNCMRCGYSNTANLSTFAGATKHVQCGNCRSTLLLHRLGGGKYKVVDSARGRLSNFAASARSASLPAPTIPPTPLAVRDELGEAQGGFTCPRCQNRIAYSVPANQRTVERPCFTCFAVVEYDRSARSTKLLSAKQPVFLESIHTDTIECVNCQREFFPKIFTNSEGREVACCFNCNTIYRPKSEAKQVVDRPCISPGCDGVVHFKVSESETLTKQFELLPVLRTPS